MDKFRFSIPVTMFTGDRDEACDPKLCQAIDGQNGMVKLVLFKGVHHGYEDRTAIYKHPAMGWHMEYNAKADKETMDHILATITADGTKGGPKPN